MIRRYFCIDDIRFGDFFKFFLKKIFFLSLLAPFFGLIATTMGISPDSLAFDISKLAGINDNSKNKDEKKRKSCSDWTLLLAGI